MLQPTRSSLVQIYQNFQLCIVTNKDGMIIGVGEALRTLCTSISLEQDRIRDIFDIREQIAKPTDDLLVPFNSRFILEERKTGTQFTGHSLSIGDGDALYVLNLLVDRSSQLVAKATDLRLESKTIDFREICRDVSDTLADLAKSRKISLLLDFRALSTAQFLGDRAAIRHILISLAKNAIEHTQRGIVKIEVQEANTVDDRTVLRMFIRDTGTGMTQHQVRNIYESDTNTRNPVGMTITSGLLKAMDGRIDVDSSVGVGTHIGVTIILKRSPCA